MFCLRPNQIQREFLRFRHARQNTATAQFSSKMWYPDFMELKSESSRTAKAVLCYGCGCVMAVVVFWQRLWQRPSTLTLHFDRVQQTAA